MNNTPKKLSKCPECGELHKARFEVNKARPGWEVWCENTGKTRRVVNPKYEQ